MISDVLSRIRLSYDDPDSWEYAIPPSLPCLYWAPVGLLISFHNNRDLKDDEGKPVEGTAVTASEGKGEDKKEAGITAPGTGGNFQKKIETISFEEALALPSPDDLVASASDDALARGLVEKQVHRSAIDPRVPTKPQLCLLDFCCLFVKAKARSRQSIIVVASLIDRVTTFPTLPIGMLSPRFTIATAGAKKTKNKARCLIDWYIV